LILLSEGSLKWRSSTEVGRVHFVERFSFAGGMAGLLFGFRGDIF